MLKYPTFKPHFQVEIISPDRVYLFTEKERYVLKGKLYARLAPYLNGQNSVDEIVVAVKQEVNFFKVYQALRSLEARGYLAERATLAKGDAAFWHLAGVDPAALAKTAVSLTTLGNIDPEPIRAALAAQSISVNEAAPHHLVLTDDYLQPKLATINEVALRRGRSWLLAKPEGGVVWLGPLFVPQETGCWACLAQRLRGRRRLETAVVQQQNQTHPLSTTRANTFNIGTQLVAMETAKWLGKGGHAQLLGQIRTFDLTNLDWETHSLIQRPQCPVCGYGVKRNVAIQLQSAPKCFTSDGGHRITTPQTMVARYEQHISPITGIIGGIVETTLPVTTGHVYVAPITMPTVSRNLTIEDALDQTIAAGKGKSAFQAKASLIGEAIERYSVRYFDDRTTVCNSYRAMGETAVHPNILLQYSQQQFAEYVADPQRKRAKFERLAQPFDEERKIEWTPIWSLTNEQVCYVPTALTYFDYPKAPDHLFGSADSNGCAAGNTLEEAILQGFMELVERDSVAIWWYNRLQRPGVDLASFNDPYLAQVAQDMAQLGRELWVIDLTNDLGIPAFAAVTRRVDSANEEILMGFGAHFDPLIGMARAVTEAYQMLGQLSYARSQGQMSETIQWINTATIAANTYLAADEKRPLRTASDYTYQLRRDIRDDVAACVEIAAQLGLETLVLDVTQPDIGLNVVRVFVPGLRHFWSRLAPGRLYDVPVKLGWLARPLSEEELNPQAMFL
ncbi:MAG: TOMM precursor leader peptide-binding protein [Chloroflexota bacterium]